MKLPRKIAILLTVTLVTTSTIGNTPIVYANEKAQIQSLVGKDRIETAIKISNKGWTSSEEVLLVNDSAIVDALAATPFAKAKNAPILLTGTNKINEDTKKELKRLGVRKVYLIGGEKVLNKSIEEGLKSERIIVDRICGEDRYKTALEIANRLKQIKPISQIAVVNGSKGLVDAVSISAVAASKNMPIILSHPNDGIQEASNFIKQNNITQSYIIGGQEVLSKDIESKLPNPKRISGIDRKETNAKVIDEFYNKTDLKNAYIVKDGSQNETELIDALAVGVLASKNDSPIITVSNKLSGPQKNVINSKNFSILTQIGGNGNETSFKEIESIQKVNTFEVKTVKELQEAINKGDANDTINFNSRGSINESFNITSNNSITVKLSGNYTGTITINTPNGDVINNDNISNVIINDIKQGTFINNGFIDNMTVNDNNGSSIINSNNATIKKIDIKENTKSASISNNGKVDNINISEGSKEIYLKNSGTVTTIKNDTEGTKVENNGTINNVQGEQKPSIDGNKPGSGGSSSGGSSGGNTGGTNKPYPESISVQVIDDRSLSVKTKQINNPTFTISGNDYNGKVISSKYENGCYILKLDKSLGKNCDHTLTINYDGNKNLTKTIVNEVIDTYQEKTFFDADKCTLKVMTNKDSSLFKSLSLKDRGKGYTFEYKDKRWIGENGFTITEEKKGATTIISVTKNDGFYPTDVLLNCAKVEKADNIAPQVYTSVNAPYEGDITEIILQFSEEIKIYNLNNDAINDLNSIKDKYKIYKKINGEFKLQENLKVDNIRKHSNKMYLELNNYGSKLDVGEYSIKLEDLFIADFSGNKIEDDNVFKYGRSKAQVSNAEDLARELEDGTSIVIMKDNIKANKDLIVDQATNLVIESGKKLDIDGTVLKLDGKITGEGNISSGGQIRRGRNSVLFKPEIKDLGNSKVEITNIAPNAIKSIHINNTQFDREYSGIYTTTHSNMQAIKILETSEESNSKTIIELKAGEHIENYKFEVRSYGYPPVIGNNTISTKIKLETDKSELISKILFSEYKYDNTYEGTETGQYVPGAKEIYLKVIDEAKSIMNDENSSQSIIKSTIEKLIKADIAYENQKVPNKASTMEELKEGLKRHKVLLVSEDIVVDEDLHIPQEAILVIGKGKKLTITDRALNVDGKILILDGGSVSEDGKIALGLDGIMDKPSVKATTIDDISAIGITNLGGNSIESIKIGESEFRVDSDRVYTTTNPQAIDLKLLKDGPEIENKYNATPVIYFKMSTQMKPQSETLDIIVTDRNGNSDTISMPITMDVKKDTLIKEIELARDIHLNAVEGNGNGEFPQGTKAIFEQVIVEAENVRDDIYSDGNEVSQVTNKLRQATRDFRDKMNIPNVDNVQDLKNMLTQKYMEKVVLIGNIENIDSIEVPLNVELEIKENVVLINNGSLLVDGIISGAGTIEEIGLQSSIELGKEGLIFKPEVREIEVEGVSAIEISNVGEDAINSIWVDKTSFCKDRNGVYTSTHQNALGIEIKAISKPGNEDNSSNNYQPKIYLTITSKYNVKNPLIKVYDKYNYRDKIYGEATLSGITVRGN